MNRFYRIFILVICGILLYANIALSEDKSLFNLQGIYNNLFSTKNPFEPQLPKEEIEKVQPVSVVNKIKDFVQTKKSDSERNIIQEKMGTYNITSIIWDSDRPQAVINQEIYGIGDTLDNMKIVDIRKDGIDVDIRGYIFTITPK